MTMTETADFSSSTREFDCFVAAALEDLNRKKSCLKEQRKLIPQRHSTIKNYLNCQLFMLGRHETRLLRFKEDIKLRAKAAEDKNFPEAETKQIEADLAKMKTRCKHILDVTDKFCVLTDDELKLKKMKTSSIEDFTDSNSSVSSVDSPGGGGRGGIPASPTSFSLASTPTANSVSDRIVKATLESFGSHLSVIAKTYTSRRGRRSNELESSSQDVSRQHSEEDELEFCTSKKDISDSASSLSV